MERDCHNCTRTKEDDSCSLPSKDIDTCLHNPSRPFWQEKESHEPDLEDQDPYESLRQVLIDAEIQASQGKGKERHADNNNYEDQVICVVGRLLKDHPFGAHAYQIIKKTIEAGRLYKLSGADAAYKEILGAINYAAAMNILIKEKD